MNCKICGLPIVDNDQMQCIAADTGARVWIHKDCFVAQAFIVAKELNVKKYGGECPTQDTEQVIDDNTIGDIND